MSDRELLEDAAKAAGYSVVGWGDDMPIVEGDYFGNPKLSKWYWLPLRDDGDALRLAVKLRLDVSICLEQHLTIEEYDADPYAATRRAIVRAAAAMAKEPK